MIPPGSVVETSIEYPPEVAMLRNDLIATIGDRFAQIEVGTMTREVDVRAAVEAARAETAPLLAQLIELEVFGRLMMIVRSDDANSK